MTILVSESWAASGNVSGKTPTTGGGTWGVTGDTTNYSGGFAFINAPADGYYNSNCLHSATYLNAAVIVNSAEISYPGTANVLGTPVLLWARANSGLTNGYYAKFGGAGQAASAFANFQIYKRVSGVDTQLGVFGFANQLSNIAFAFHVAGTVLRVTVNSILVLEVSDATFSSAGFFGFGLSTYGDPEEAGNSRIGLLTIETPYIDVGSTSVPKNVSKGQAATIGVGYLGSADVALITNSLVSALNATRIPVNMTKINNATVLGTGTVADKWRGE